MHTDFRDYCIDYGLAHLFGTVGSKTEALVERMLAGETVTLEDYRADNHFHYSARGRNGKRHLLSDADIADHHRILCYGVEKLSKARRAFDLGLPPQHPSLWRE